MSGRRAALIILAVCACETLGMATYATFPTLLAVFRADWALSNTQIGWIGGSYFAGVALGTLILPTITDRWPAKRIYLAAMALSIVAALGFAVVASGFWTASAWRFAQGVGLGGTYLPGLRALLRTVPAAHHGRATALYTSTFYVGASLSYFAAGELEIQLDWQSAFAWSALGPTAAFLLAAAVLRYDKPTPSSSSHALFDFRPLLRNRTAVAYTIAYGAHTAELLVVHTWLVAFLAFSRGLQLPGTVGIVWTGATIVALINLVALPASIGTNEIAMRLGRARTISAAMISSGLLGIGLAAFAAFPFPLVLLMSLLLLTAVTADSATLTNGLRASVSDEFLGRALAVYSVTGFLGGSLSPLLFGFVLDAGGGADRQSAWVWAHAIMSVVFLVGPLSLFWLVSRSR